MLLERIYEVFPLVCPACHTEMRLVALITDRASISRSLRFAVRLRWAAQGTPSLACPLDGAKVHRTFATAPSRPRAPRRADAAPAGVPRARAPGAGGDARPESGLRPDRPSARAGARVRPTGQLVGQGSQAHGGYRGCSAAARAHSPRPARLHHARCLSLGASRARPRRRLRAGPAGRGAHLPPAGGGGGVFVLAALNKAYPDLPLANGLRDVRGVVVQRAGTRRRDHKRYD